MTTKVLKENKTRGGKTMKRIVVLGVLVLALTTSLLVGCAEKELTQEEIEQLVADVLIANAEVDTVKFDMNMLTTIEEIGGPKTGEATMVGDGTGAIDNVNKEMQMTINMTMDIPDQGKQDIPVEYYLVDGWMHIKMSIPEMGEQWMKMRLPEEMWEKQSQIDQQIELLETAKEVNFLGSEDVSGTACYVVEIVPSMEALGKLLSQFEMPDMEGIDPVELNLADLIKEMSIKQWIAEDSYLIMKSQTHVLMEMRPEDIGPSGEDFEKITMDQNTMMTFYDYNEPVSIELPEEALEASEVPGS